MLVAPLLILVAIMILEMPLVSTETPISVPMAQTDAEGHFAKINMPISRLVTASNRNHPQSGMEVLSEALVDFSQEKAILQQSTFVMRDQTFGSPTIQSEPAQSIPPGTRRTRSNRSISGWRPAGLRLVARREYPLPIGYR